MLDERLAMVVEFEESDQTFVVTMSDAPVIRPYSGPYVVTPSQTEQRLPTAGKDVESDIIVEAIPSYYGLITWDGSVLTVS